jgi:hypothetical protein
MVTVMVSFSEPEVMVACPEAAGRHALMAADDGIRLKEKVLLAAVALAEAVRPMAAATAAAVARAPNGAHAGIRERRVTGRIEIMAVPPDLRVARSEQRRRRSRSTGTGRLSRRTRVG